MYPLYECYTKIINIYRLDTKYKSEVFAGKTAPGNENHVVTTGSRMEPRQVAVLDFNAVRHCTALVRPARQTDVMSGTLYDCHATFA